MWRTSLYQEGTWCQSRCHVTKSWAAQQASLMWTIYQPMFQVKHKLICAAWHCGLLPVRSCDPEFMCSWRDTHNWLEDTLFPRCGVLNIDNSYSSIGITAQEITVLRFVNDLIIAVRITQPLRHYSNRENHAADREVVRALSSSSRIQS